jgi:hypothetical protein
MTEAPAGKKAAFAVGQIFGPFIVFFGIGTLVTGHGGWLFLALIPCALLLSWGSKDKYGQEYDYARPYDTVD